MKKFHINKPWEAYVFLTPWLIGLLCFTVIPMFMSLYFSFTQYDMASAPKWIGLGNYIDMARDPRLAKSLKVTFTYVGLSIPLQLSFALFLAAVLKKNRRGVRFYRAIYYLPSLFGGSVAVALLWRQIFNKTGIINRILSWGSNLLNLDFVPKNWISSPSTVLYTLVALAIWQFGASMVVFLGGLKQICSDYYEAAEIDGANKVQTFFKITLPLLTPMVFFNLVMTIINAFQAFTPSYIISQGTGGPMDSTMFYTLYLYTKGFRQYAMGYASAMAWVLLLIIALVTALMFGAANRWVYYEDIEKVRV